MTLSAQEQASRSRYHSKPERHSWARVQKLYAFCRARAIDRIATADAQPTTPTSLKPLRDLRTLETMYAKAQQTRWDNDVVTSCAVTYFRMIALQDADHPDFLGEWI